MDRDQREGGFGYHGGRARPVRIGILSLVVVASAPACGDGAPARARTACETMLAEMGIDHVPAGPREGVAEPVDVTAPIAGIAYRGIDGLSGRERVGWLREPTPAWGQGAGSHNLVVPRVVLSACL